MANEEAVNHREDESLMLEVSRRRTMTTEVIERASRSVTKFAFLKERERFLQEYSKTELTQGTGGNNGLNRKEEMRYTEEGSCSEYKEDSTQNINQVEIDLKEINIVMGIGGWILADLLSEMSLTFRRAQCYAM